MACELASSSQTATDDRRVKHFWEAGLHKNHHLVRNGHFGRPIESVPMISGMTGPAATGKFINMGNKKTDAWMDQDVSFFWGGSWVFFHLLCLSLFLKNKSSLFLTVGKPVKPPFFRHILRWCFCLEQLEVKHISGVIFPSKIEDFLPKHKSFKHMLYHFVAFLSFFIASFPLDIRDAAGWLDLALGV